MRTCVEDPRSYTVRSHRYDSDRGIWRPTITPLTNNIQRWNLIPPYAQEMSTPLPNTHNSTGYQSIKSRPSKHDERMRCAAYWFLELLRWLPYTKPMGRSQGKCIISSGLDETTQVQCKQSKTRKCNKFWTLEWKHCDGAKMECCTRNHADGEDRMGRKRRIEKDLVYQT